MGDTYNGWKNYPTWNVNLWIDNEQGTYNHARAMADTARADAPNDRNVAQGIWTVEETERFRLADAIKDWVRDELTPDLGASFAADLLGYALDQVDWTEIAEHWLDDAEPLGNFGIT